MIHVRFEGRSFDLQEQELSVCQGMTDAEIKQRMAEHFDVDVARFGSYVVDRIANGNVIVRPEAVYG